VVDEHGARGAATGRLRAQHGAADLQPGHEALDVPVAPLGECARDVAPARGHPDARPPDPLAQLDPHERVARGEQVRAVGEHVDPHPGRLLARRLGGVGGDEQERQEHEGAGESHRSLQTRRVRKTCGLRPWQENPGRPSEVRRRP
jgi:hypothetical protein